MQGFFPLGHTCYTFLDRISCRVKLRSPNHRHLHRQTYLQYPVPRPYLQDRQLHNPHTVLPSWACHHRSHLDQYWIHHPHHLYQQHLYEQHPHPYRPAPHRLCLCRPCLRHPHQNYSRHLQAWHSFYAVSYLCCFPLFYSYFSLSYLSHILTRAN